MMVTIDGWLHIRDGVRVNQSGVNHGKEGIILARDGSTIAVKWPGGTHWAGRGDRIYHPVNFAVYTIIEAEMHGLVETLKVKALIDWENTRRPPKAQGGAGQ